METIIHDVNKITIGAVDVNDTYVVRTITVTTKRGEEFIVKMFGVDDSLEITTTIETKI